MKSVRYRFAMGAFAFTSLLAVVQVGATCYFNWSAGCCALSAIHPPRIGPGDKCEDEWDCGSLIITDVYALTVTPVVSGGHPNLKWAAGGGTCTSAPGKCYQGNCIYGPPATVTCLDFWAVDGPC